MIDKNLGTTVSTTAGSVTLAVDDSCNLNATYIEASTDDTYSVTLNSSFSYDEDNVVVTGRGSGEKMEVSQSKGNISISNCQIISVSIDGVSVTNHTISATASEGGMITPEGDSIVAAGNSITYSFQAQEGYELSDVLVDGISIGAVTSYEFTQVSADHQIRAVFIKKQIDPPPSPTPTPAPGENPGQNVALPAVKQTNVITTQDLALTTASKERKIKLEASANGQSQLSYSSDNPDVRVGADGIITIKKDFVGQAVITIRSAETEQYTSASKTVTVTVNPTGTKIKKLKKEASGKLTVTWKKNDKVTGYQISYSTASDFKNEKIRTVKKNKTESLVLKKLKKKKYFVRVRTYKSVGGKKYYSKWSKGKGVTLK